MDLWQTKEGTVMLVRHMTDKHLANAIRMLERGADATGARCSQRSIVLGLPMLRAEQARRLAEPPLPGELDARLRGELADIVWWAARLLTPQDPAEDAWLASLEGRGTPPTSPTSSSDSTPSDPSG